MTIAKKVAVNVGWNIRLLRIKQRPDMTAKEVARELKISANYLSLIERGHRTPSWKLLDRVAKLFGVPLQELLSDPSAVHQDALADLRRLFQGMSLSASVELIKTLVNPEPTHARSYKRS